MINLVPNETFNNYPLIKNYFGHISRTNFGGYCESLKFDGKHPKISETKIRELIFKIGFIPKAVMYYWRGNRSTLWRINYSKISCFVINSNKFENCDSFETYSLSKLKKYLEQEEEQRLI